MKAMNPVLTRCNNSMVANKMLFCFVCLSIFQEQTVSQCFITRRD